MRWSSLARKLQKGSIQFFSILPTTLTRLQSLDILEYFLPCLKDMTVVLGVLSVSMDLKRMGSHFFCIAVQNLERAF